MAKFEYGSTAVYRGGDFLNPIIKIGIRFDSKVHRKKNKSGISYYVEGFKGREWLFEEEIKHLSILRRLMCYFSKT
jgi:hypothetical protein